MSNKGIVGRLSGFFLLLTEPKRYGGYTSLPSTKRGTRVLCRPSNPRKSGGSGKPLTSVDPKTLVKRCKVRVPRQILFLKILQSVGGNARVGTLTGLTVKRTDPFMSESESESYLSESNKRIFQKSWRINGLNPESNSLVTLRKVRSSPLSYTCVAGVCVPRPLGHSPRPRDVPVSEGAPQCLLGNHDPELCTYPRASTPAPRRPTLLRYLTCLHLHRLTSRTCPLLFPGRNSPPSTNPLSGSLL